MAECLDLLKDDGLAGFESNLFDNAVDWSGHENNKDEQQLEIQILESMFPKELEVISSSEEHGCRNTLQLAVHVNIISKPILIELWASGNDGVDCSVVDAVAKNRPETERPVFNRTISGNRLYTSMFVNNLTPVILTLVLPETYPVEACPVFTLSCQWLSSTQLSAVATKLESLYTENQGEQILYIWANWIQNDLLNSLSLQSVLIIDELETVLDPRISIDDTDSFARFAEVVTYDFSLTEKQFLTELQTCLVCYKEDSGSNFIRLIPCLHHYCFDCITEFCTMHVQDGTIGQLRCPDDDCKNSISPDVLNRVLGDDHYARWERLMVQRSLEEMGDIAWCPRCSNPVVKDSSEDSLGICPVCSFSFCTKCDDIWHPGELCKELRTEENRRMLKLQRQQAEGPKQQDLRAAREEMYRRFQERQVGVEHNGRKPIKTCPGCRIKIEKSAGCNKMTCRCGTIFCWLCGVKISGYDHFGRGCQTFSFTQPASGPRKEVQFHEGYIAYRAALMNNQLVRQKQCPRCRNKNPKMGRLNLVKCWFCKGHFCFQCGDNLSKVDKATSHYSLSKTCSQHSD